MLMSLSVFKSPNTRVVVGTVIEAELSIEKKVLAIRLSFLIKRKNLFFNSPEIGIFAANCLPGIGVLLNVDVAGAPLTNVLLERLKSERPAVKVSAVNTMS